MLIHNPEHLEAHKLTIASKNPNRRKIAALKAKCTKHYEQIRELETKEEVSANVESFEFKIAEYDQRNESLDSQQLCNAAIEEILADMDPDCNGYSIMLQMMKRLGYEYKDESILQK